MTRSPLLRACVAFRLPRGLYLLRGEVPLSDAEIRANLRRTPAAAERLVLALAETLSGMLIRQIDDSAEIWPMAAAVVRDRRLPASMVGVLVTLAMLPEEGAVEPSEWALVVEAAP
jgi:hypothetical protein